jgi:hypothetical protein
MHHFSSPLGVLRPVQDLLHVPWDRLGGLELGNALAEGQLAGGVLALG